MKKILAFVCAFIIVFSFNACSLNDVAEWFGNEKLEEIKNKIENNGTPEPDVPADATRPSGPVVVDDEDKIFAKVYKLGDIIPVKDEVGKTQSVKSIRVVTDLTDGSINYDKLIIDSSIDVDKYKHFVLTEGDETAFNLSKDSCLIIIEYERFAESDKDEVLDDEWFNEFSYIEIVDPAAGEIVGGSLCGMYGLSIYSALKYVDYEPIEGYAPDPDPRMVRNFAMKTNEPFPMTIGLVFKIADLQYMIEYCNDNGYKLGLFLYQVRQGDTFTSIVVEIPAEVLEIS